MNTEIPENSHSEIVHERGGESVEVTSMKICLRVAFCGKLWFVSFEVFTEALLSSEMWCRVILWKVPDILKDCSAFVFRIKQYQKAYRQT
jgi:hypothetical protein